MANLLSGNLLYHSHGGEIRTNISQSDDVWWVTVHMVRFFSFLSVSLLFVFFRTGCRVLFSWLRRQVFDTIDMHLQKLWHFMSLDVNSIRVDVEILAKEKKKKESKKDTSTHTHSHRHMHAHNEVNRKKVTQPNRTICVHCKYGTSNHCCTQYRLQLFECLITFATNHLNYVDLFQYAFHSSNRPRADAIPHNGHALTGDFSVFLLRFGESIEWFNVKAAVTAGCGATTTQTTNCLQANGQIQRWFDRSKCICCLVWRWPDRKAIRYSNALQQACIPKTRSACIVASSQNWSSIRKLAERRKKKTLQSNNNNTPKIECTSETHTVNYFRFCCGLLLLLLPLVLVRMLLVLTETPTYNICLAYFLWIYQKTYLHSPQIQHHCNKHLWFFT